MKFTEIKNILVVYLNAISKDYKNKQEQLLNSSDSYLAPHIKSKVTSFINEISKLEKTIPDQAYSQARCDKISGKMIDLYFKKALKIVDDKEEEFISTEEIKKRLGIEGYELMKSYFSLKAGIMALENELIEKNREELKELIRKFNLIKKHWESEILI